MLSKDLYVLCNDLSCHISKENSFIDSISFLDNSIISYINSKNSFLNDWKSLLNLKCNKLNFNVDYNIIEQNSMLMKIILNLHQTFYSYNIKSHSTDSYIIILQYSKNSYKIISLVSGDDAPLLYSSIFKTSLEDIYLYFHANIYLTELWNNKYKTLKVLYNTFSNIHDISNRDSPSFDVDSACRYAEKYAMNLNSEYKDFTDIGGDCTNFVSQILYAGKLNTTKTWHPYSNAWVRVKELYEYLLYNNIAFALPNNVGLDKGCIIQFLIPTTNRFSHTAFITHNIKGKDYLYCCHSYNKLNYPLSLTYPILYKSMRSLMIN